MDHAERALVLAAENGHVEIVQLLLQAGAKKDSVNWAGSTALMLAAKNDHVEIAQLLHGNKGRDKRGWNAPWPCGDCTAGFEAGANTHADGWPAFKVARLRSGKGSPDHPGKAQLRCP